MIDRKPNLCGVQMCCMAEIYSEPTTDCRFCQQDKNGNCIHADWTNSEACACVCRCEEANYDAARQICLGLSHLAPPHQMGCQED